MQNNGKDTLKELENAPIAKLLWKYSLPAIVGTVVMSLYNVIDRIFIGQGVGADAIAGLAITFPVMNLAAALGMLVGVGASARISIVLGQKDKLKAEQILGNSLILIIAIASVYLTIFAIFLDPILITFGASAKTLPYAHDFMVYLLPGMFMMNICYSFNNIMRASGYPQKAMVTMLIGAGCNIILAPIFIFALDMGIKGAAIATDISMTISSAFVMAHFFSLNSEIHFKKGIYRLQLPIIMSIIAIGASPFLINVAGSAINAIINNTLYRYGSDAAVAAAGIFTTYAQLLVMIVIGVCQGMQPIIGYNYGSGHFDRLRKTFILSVMAATVICTLGSLGAMLFPTWIARAFTSDEHLIAVTANGLSLSIVMFWMVGFQIVSTNFFQSLGMAGKSIFLSLTRQVIFLIPLLFTLPHFFGLNGVWTSFPTSDLLATIVTAILITWQFRKLAARQQQNSK
ncbi:MAG: MATE family efflux transporter [Muribaculaceae bacterium]